MKRPTTSAAIVTGTLADAIVQAIEAGGGYMSRADLAARGHKLDVLGPFAVSTGIVATGGRRFFADPTIRFKLWNFDIWAVAASKSRQLAMATGSHTEAKLKKMPPTPVSSVRLI